MFKNHVAVIGSGPVGSYLALKLLRKGYRVTMFDIGASDEPANHIRTKTKFRSMKKNARGVGDYDVNQFVKYADLEKNVGFPSKAQFGFSSLWGATWELEKINSDLEFVSLQKELRDDIFFPPTEIRSRYGNLNFNFNQETLCNTFLENMSKINRSETPSLNAKRTELLISQERCRGTGLCQVGCEFDAIWNAQFLFEACLTYSEFTYLDGHFITSVEKLESGWHVYDQKDDLGAYGSVFLCAGPIGNSNILLRSKVTNKIILQDTSLRYILFFNFFKTCNHTKDFSLSMLTVNFKDFNGIKRHIQMYSHLNMSIERLIPKTKNILKKIIFFLLSQLKHRICVGLEYVEPRGSKSVEITINDSQRIVTRIIEAEVQDDRLRFLLRKISKTGLLPIVLLKKGVGESYHLGSASVELEDNHEIAGFQNLFAFGSFSLQPLEPGPVTSYALFDITKFTRGMN